MTWSLTCARFWGQVHVQRTSDVMTTFCGTFGFVYKRVRLYQPSSCFPRCLGAVRCDECLLHPLFSLRLSINATRRWYSCMWPLRSHWECSDLEEPHVAKPSPCGIIHWLAHFVCRGDVMDVANGIHGRIKTLCAASTARLTTDILSLLTFRQRCHFSSFSALQSSRALNRCERPLHWNETFAIKSGMVSAESSVPKP